MPAKRLTEADVAIAITTEEEDESPRGSYSIPGITINEDDCARFVELVEEMIADHGIWGWCCVKVNARIGSLEGFAYLGGCSYKDEADFKEDGYYKDMVNEAIAELQVQVDELYALIHVEVSLEDRLKKIEWSDGEDQGDYAGA